MYELVMSRNGVEAVLDVFHSSQLSKKEAEVEKQNQKAPEGVSFFIRPQ